MEYDAVLEGHQRQYLTAPPIKSIRLKKRLRPSPLLIFIAEYSSWT
jgi:hypothetical protein